MELTASVRPGWLRRWSSSRYKEAILGVLFTLPWLIRLFALHVYPFLAAFFFSFTRYSVLQPPKFVGFDNYIQMLTVDELPGQALYNSLYFSIGSVPLRLVLALFLAVLLNQKIHGLSFFRAVF